MLGDLEEGQRERDEGGEDGRGIYAAAMVVVAGWLDGVVDLSVDRVWVCGHDGGLKCCDRELRFVIWFVDGGGTWQREVYLCLKWFT